MSIFGTILSKIFPAHHPAVDNASSGPGSSVPPATVPASATATATAATTAVAGQASTTSPAAPANANENTLPPQVDVAQVLDGLAARHKERLDWRHSIVDMMKLLELDSSLANRQQLARELHYSGNTGDSVAMNQWLHREVMAQLAANGGQVPADLQA